MTPAKDILEIIQLMKLPGAGLYRGWHPKAVKVAMMVDGPTETPGSEDHDPKSGPPEPCEGELAAIRAELENLKKHLPDRLTRVGAILGIVVAIFNVIAAAWAGYQWWTSAPQLSAYSATKLVIRYLPDANRMQLGFDFTLANFGQKDNIVEEIAGAIQPMPAATAMEAITLSSIDFQCAL